MSKISTRVPIAIFCCLALLSVVWVAPAHALSDEFVCKCKGIDDKTQPYLKKTCGMGYKVANKGRVDTNIPPEKIGKYLDASEANDLKWDSCLYSPQSGWKCARMLGANNIVPGCINR